MSDIQHYQSERPAFSGARPKIEGGYVVGVERFSVPPLPESIIDMVFAKFGLRYTKRWAEETACVNIGDLKMEWRRSMAGLDVRAIKWALDELPDSRPPTVGEFSTLCKKWPGRSRDEEKPKGNHPIAGSVAKEIKRMLEKNILNKAESDRIAKMERMGIKSDFVPGPSSPIPASSLPKAMRDAINSGEINYWDKGKK